ncbi:hypothetical protein EDB85DRAFT_2196429 [Lactarius pseudohatsudake]|nr:hypothetical protein EDB85DRAFT_2196429 [Lactarius pseudohatsudake]
MILAVGRSAGKGCRLRKWQAGFADSFPGRVMPSPDAQPRAARAINPHRRPAIDNSKTRRQRQRQGDDGLDGHQPPPPPPPPPCHRQWQDNVNNSNNPDDDDDDDDDDTDDTDDIDETTTTGHENDWTQRLGRDGSDVTASPATGILTSSVVVYKVKIKVVVYLGKYQYSTGFYWLRSVLIATIPVPVLRYFSENGTSSSSSFPHLRRKTGTVLNFKTLHGTGHVTQDGVEEHVRTAPSPLLLGTVRTTPEATRRLPSPGLRAEPTHKRGARAGDESGCAPLLFAHTGARSNLEQHPPLPRLAREGNAQKRHPLPCASDTRASEPGAHSVPERRPPSVHALGQTRTGHIMISGGLYD